MNGLFIVCRLADIVPRNRGEDKTVENTEGAIQYLQSEEEQLMVGGDEPHVRVGGWPKIQLVPIVFLRYTDAAEPAVLWNIRPGVILKTIRRAA